MEKMELPLLKGSDREKCIPITVIVGLIGLVVFFLTCIFSFNFIKVIISYIIVKNSNLDYTVNLKDNSFGMKTIRKDENKEIISSLVDTIDAKFSYNFKSNENLGLNILIM